MGWRRSSQERVAGLCAPLIGPHQIQLHGFRGDQTATGVADSVNGMEEIVAGTGGGTLRSFDRPASNSVARIQGRFGVLKVWLGDGEYRRAFVTTDGRVWDVGGRRCR